MRAPETKTVCSIEGCDLPTRANGLCNRHNAAKWYREHRDRARESHRRYRAAHPRPPKPRSVIDPEKAREKARETQRRWRAANREKDREHSRRWRAAHPEWVRERNAYGGGRSQALACQLVQDERIRSVSNHHKGMSVLKAELGDPRPDGHELSLRPDRTVVGNESLYLGYVTRRGEHLPYVLSIDPDDYGWDLPEGNRDQPTRDSELMEWLRLQEAV